MTLDQLLRDAGAHIDALIDRHGVPTTTQEDTFMTIIDDRQKTGEPIRHQPRGWAILAAAAVVVGLVVGIAAITRDSDESTPVAEQPAPTSLSQDRSVQDGHIEKIVFDGSNLWATRQGSTFLSRLDPATGAVTESLTLTSPATPGRAVLHEGSLYVPTTGGVVVVDTATGAVSEPFAGSDSSEVWGVAITDDGVWLTRRTQVGETLERWDGALAEQLVEVDLGAEPGFGIVGNGDQLYLATKDRGLQRYDPQGRLVATIAGIGFAYEMEMGDDGTLWVADFDAGELVAVDTSTDTVRSRVELADKEVTTLEVTSHAVWVGVYLEQELAVVDIDSGNVTATAALSGRPQTVAVVDDAVWVSGDGGWAIRFVPG